MPTVNIINNYPDFTLLAPAVNKIISKIASEEHCRIENISIVVTDDPTVNQLKLEYFQDDVMTDTISFNFNYANQPIDGEIYLSIDRIRENAAKFENTFRKELALVIIHSILHLIGYEDSTTELKAQMQKVQQCYLEQLNIRYLFRNNPKKNRIMPAKSSTFEQFERLIAIVKTLRGSSGCEWDRAQTSESLTPYFLEEAYETIEAIHEDDQMKLKEELGDLMLHIVFQADIAQEKKTFDLADSLKNICDKLERRHPHVFGDTVVNGIAEIKQNWEEIKLEEGRKSLMEGLPKTLPALLFARRIQERASQVGFDWDKIDSVWEKVHEEIDELKEAIEKTDREMIELELGDLLFSLVNLSRFLDINPEQALKATSAKFVNRFQYIEEKLNAKNQSLKDTTLEEMDSLWNEIRTAEKRP